MFSLQTAPRPNSLLDDFATMCENNAHVTGAVLIDIGQQEKSKLQSDVHKMN